nr:13918_t:CDS:2 [Entrophospora candida]
MPLEEITCKLVGSFTFIGLGSYLLYNVIEKSSPSKKENNNINIMMKLIGLNPRIKYAGNIALGVLGVGK